MQVDTLPTAADSYARTLIQRGCPPLLVQMTGQVLAGLDGTPPTPEEQALITRAYAHLSH